MAAVKYMTDFFYFWKNGTNTILTSIYTNDTNNAVDLLLIFFCLATNRSAARFNVVKRSKKSRAGQSDQRTVCLRT